MPWRFSVPVLAAVYELLARIDPKEDAVRDAIGDRIADLAQQLPTARQHSALAAAIIDAALAHPTLRQPEELLMAARPYLLGPNAPVRAGRGRGPTAVAGRRSTTRDLPAGLVAFRLGLKPIMRFESEEELITAGLDEKTVGEVGAVVRQRKVGGSGKSEFFMGHDAATVDQAIRLTEATERTNDVLRWQEAAGKVGELLGYPSCCRRAFATKSPVPSNSWLHVAARVKVPGEVPFLLNPHATAVLEYVPCSLGCARSLERAEQIVGALREQLGAARLARLLRSFRHPWLILVDYDNEAVELCTDEVPDRRFRYRAGKIHGHHPLAARVAEGDELVVEEQQLVVLRGGREHAVLGARAFIWWYRQAVQRELWQAMVDLRCDPRWAAPLSFQGRTTSTPARTLAAELQDIIAEGGDGLTYHGFRVANVDTRHHQRVSVRLSDGRSEIELYLAPRAEVQDAYAIAGPLAGMIAHDAPPVDSVAKDRAIRLFVRKTAGAMVARLRARRNGG